MKNTNNYQAHFNEILQDSIAKHLSLVQEISEILEISTDSAYRRLRNETEYTLAEAVKIGVHFNIPLESLNQPIAKAATFKINHMANNLNSYQQYLDNMLAGVKQLSEMEGVELFFAAEDIPVFYHFNHPTLRHFKISYWLKSLLNIPEYQQLNIEDIELPENIISTAQAVFEKFNQLNSTEIWTEETIVSTLKQIKFYWDAGFFNTNTTAFAVLDDLQALIESIKLSCDVGYKFNNGTMTQSSHTFYFSDLMIGNNAILAKSAAFKTSFISYSTFNFMQTGNKDFNNQNEFWMNNIISKSTLLSKVAEKQRNQFFRNAFQQLKKLHQYISESDSNFEV